MTSPKTEHALAKITEAEDATEKAVDLLHAATHRLTKAVVIDDPRGNLRGIITMAMQDKIRDAHASVHRDRLRAQDPTITGLSALTLNTVRAAEEYYAVLRQVNPKAAEATAKHHGQPRNWTSEPLPSPAWQDEPEKTCEGMAGHEGTQP